MELSEQLPGLTVDAEREDGRVTLHLLGELDLVSAPVLQRHVDELPWSELEELVLDLAEITFMDSSGLGTIITAFERTEAAQRGFAVRHVPRQPRRVFELAGVFERLNVEG